MNGREDFVYQNSRLVRARQERGYTLAEVARRTGIDAAQLCGYEKCRHYPKKETAKKIANVFGYTAEYLFPEFLKVSNKSYSGCWDSRRGKFSQTLNNDEIDRLPYQGRDYYELLEKGEKARRLLCSLKESYRRVVMMHLGFDKPELNFEQIGRIEDVTRAAACNRFHRAIEELRQPWIRKKIED